VAGAIASWKDARVRAVLSWAGFLAPYFQSAPPLSPDFAQHVAVPVMYAAFQNDTLQSDAMASAYANTARPRFELLLRAHGSSGFEAHLGFTNAICSGAATARLADCLALPEVQAYEQASLFGAGFLFMHHATGLVRSDDGLTVVLEGGRSIGAQAVIIATGASYRRLDIPELEPVPRDHVLTKTFFLLRNFPGRFTSGQMWVEALPHGEQEDARRPARAGDGVSSILITSNDLAGAWAMRPDGQPMLPMVPGEPRQREFAFRAGVNIVMYALTGNYKADQVHIPALLERLGQ